MSLVPAAAPGDEGTHSKAVTNTGEDNAAVAKAVPPAAEHPATNELSIKASPSHKITQADPNTVNAENFIRTQLRQNLKDRAFLLNVERSLIDFVKNEKLDHHRFQTMNPFYRMLVHNICNYFMLGHTVDHGKQCVIAFKTEKSKIPQLSFQSIIDSLGEAESKQPSDRLEAIHANGTSTHDERNSSPTVSKSAHPSPQKKQILKRDKDAAPTELSENKNDSAMNKKMSAATTRTFEEKNADYQRAKNRIFNNNGANTNHHQPPYQHAKNNGFYHPNGGDNKQFTILNRPPEPSQHQRMPNGAGLAHHPRPQPVLATTAPHKLQVPDALRKNPFTFDPTHSSASSPKTNMQQPPPPPPPPPDLKPVPPPAILSPYPPGPTAPHPQLPNHQFFLLPMAAMPNHAQQMPNGQIAFHPHHHQQQPLKVDHPPQPRLAPPPPHYSQQAFQAGPAGFLIGPPPASMQGQQPQQYSLGPPAMLPPPPPHPQHAQINPISVSNDFAKAQFNAIYGQAALSLAARNNFKLPPGGTTQAQIRPENKPKQPPVPFMSRPKTFAALPVDNSSVIKPVGIANNSHSSPSFVAPPPPQQQAPPQQAFEHSLVVNPHALAAAAAAAAAASHPPPYQLVPGSQFMASFPLGAAAYPPPLLHNHQLFHQPGFPLMAPPYRPPVPFRPSLPVPSGPTNAAQPVRMLKGKPAVSAKRPSFAAKPAITGPVSLPIAEKSDSTALTVQVYDLKQNLTKKALQDMLTPLVSSIDFKSKRNGAGDGEPQLLPAASNVELIDEAKEDVFVRFENIDKLNEAFRLFNVRLNGSDVTTTTTASPPPPFSLRPITT